MTVGEFLFDPFIGSEAMRRALAASLAISVAGAPLGVMLIIRRMALAGDVLTHTLLPGVAVAFLLAGESPLVMIIGGTLSGLLAVYLSMLVSRSTILREDTSLAAFYVLSLAIGVLLLSFGADDPHGDAAEELLHILFGNALEIDQATLLTIAIISTGSLIVLAVIYRLLVIESFDPVFLRSVGGPGALVHMVFMTLIVLNLIAGAVTIGTMLAIGLMTVPGAAARMWTQDLGRVIAIAIAIAVFASLSGLIAAYHLSLPPGPAIILMAGLCFMASIVFGRQNGLIQRLRHPAHLEG
ncbi:MAG: metal ABC transporter permease [Rhodospirillales bacterium]|nr:metal ABC transporter permease [Rhodospirillales bacterium]